jgi:hypothetical protein
MGQRLRVRMGKRLRVRMGQRLRVRMGKRLRVRMGGRGTWPIARAQGNSQAVLTWMMNKKHGWADWRVGVGFPSAWNGHCGEQGP